MIVAETRLVEHEIGSTLGHVIAGDGLFALLQLEVTVDDVINVQFAVGYLTVKVADLLESQFTDKHLHDAFVQFYFAVLEFTLKCFLGKQSFLDLRFLQGEADFRLCTRGLHDVQPVVFGLLVRRRHDFHLVAALQHLAERHDLAVDACARAGIANLRMDVVGEVKDGSTLRELIEVALRREHKYLVFVEVHLELVHRLHAVAGFQHRTDIGKPFVQS